ncbi:MAG TPA: hypothetical protein VFC74_03330 [Oscillospiraceae bacterium]|nr:hypothetical protein [Oscillospiraceae bacterium]
MGENDLASLAKLMFLSEAEQELLGQGARGEALLVVAASVCEQKLSWLGTRKSCLGMGVVANGRYSHGARENPSCYHSGCIYAGDLLGGIFRSSGGHGAYSAYG